ncbi:hypothetical protein [Roseisolibacter sp. H3M3-2]|uniref:hypothetical protein n=1 Tax=Roseisolibacter sp. H3M3-2 TaxID=3031323 RepID=UPI0023DA859F|nr:hypothetical protein [Roseisolibacter sp. H3M3-2]MDF1504996.1 hypothetical protein [Roseisolibacter sp. H3M3-2]
MPLPSMSSRDPLPPATPVDPSRLQLALALRARDGRLVAAAYAALAGFDAAPAGGEGVERPVPDRTQLSLFAR